MGCYRWTRLAGEHYLMSVYLLYGAFITSAADVYERSVSSLQANAYLNFSFQAIAFIPILFWMDWGKYAKMVRKVAILFFTNMSLTCQSQLAVLFVHSSKNRCTKDRRNIIQDDSGFSADLKGKLILKPTRSYPASRAFLSGKCF